MAGQGCADAFATGKHPTNSAVVAANRAADAFHQLLTGLAALCILEELAELLQVGHMLSADGSLKHAAALLIQLFERLVESFPRIEDALEAFARAGFFLRDAVESGFYDVVKLLQGLAILIALLSDLPFLRGELGAVFVKDLIHLVVHFHKVIDLAEAVRGGARSPVGGLQD